MFHYLEKLTNLFAVENSILGIMETILVFNSTGRYGNQINLKKNIYVGLYNIIYYIENFEVLIRTEHQERSSHLFFELHCCQSTITGRHLIQAVAECSDWLARHTSLPKPIFRELEIGMAQGNQKMPPVGGVLFPLEISC